MSIVDAINRAKQQSRKPSANDEPSHPTIDNRGQSVSSDVTALHVPQPASVPERVLSSRSVAFSELNFDVNSCMEKRLIVPGVDDEMLQTASPPYRMLRTRLLQTCRTNGWSILAITSPGPGEGKSVTAINLAITIAKEGNHDVFLLDLDMRNPSICRYLGLTPKNEITDFFSGETEPEGVFFHIGIARLTIAGCIDGTSHASELLATDRLDQLIAFIKTVSANPLILIDLPPVVITDDALVVIPRVHATVLVVAEGATKREGLERAVSLLSNYSVAGIVLNKTNESIGGEYYRNTVGEAGSIS
jgi:protein-tyrosine kinase